MKAALLLLAALAMGEHSPGCTCARSVCSPCLSGSLSAQGGGLVRGAAVWLQTQLCLCTTAAEPPGNLIPACAATPACRCKNGQGTCERPGTCCACAACHLAATPLPHLRAALQGFRWQLHMRPFAAQTSHQHQPSWPRTAPLASRPARCAPSLQVCGDYDQCGGVGFTGCTGCNTGFACTTTSLPKTGDK